MSTNNYVGAVPTALKVTDPNLAQAGSILARESGYGSRRRTVIELNNHKIVGADEAGVVGKFIEKMYTFPVGRMVFEGASINAIVTYSNAVGVNATASGDFALGSAVGAGATLTTTETTYIQTTDIGAAVASVHTLQTGSQPVSSSIGAPQVLDGSSAAKDVYFNLLIDDGNQDITGTPTDAYVSGEIVLHWTYLGDK